MATTALKLATRSFAAAVRVAIFAAPSLATVLVLAAIVDRASARDAGQWAGQSLEVQEWFRSLMTPDHPTVSCCGVADGYPVEHWEAAGPDHQDFKVTLEDGRKFYVPASKAQWRSGNPTGRDILFVHDGFIFCFVRSAEA